MTKRLSPRYALVLAALAGACSNLPREPAWDIRPQLEVRHGMRAADAYYQLGRHHQLQGQGERAEQFYRQAIAADEAHALAHVGLGVQLAARGALDEALAELARARNLAPQLALVHNNYGYALQRAGRRAEAHAAYQRALALDPEFARARANLNALQDEDRQSAAAMPAGPRAAAAAAAGADPFAPAASAPDPAAPAPSVPAPGVAASVAASNAAAYYAIGRRYQDAGRPYLALAAYQRVLDADPAHRDARNARAVLYALTGETELAQREMQDLLALQPASARAHNNLGYLNYLRGEHAAAIEHFRAALERDPEFARAAANLRLAREARAASLLPGPAQAMPVADATRFELLRDLPAATARAASAPAADAPAADGRTTGAPASSAPTAGAAAMQASCRLEISNGNGSAGAARRLGEWLAQRGILAVRYTNLPRFEQIATVIEYRPGCESAAHSLRQTLSGAAGVEPGPALRAGIELRVLLGKDDAAGSARLAAAPRQGRTPAPLY